MTRRLLIAGAGDFAREVLWNAADIPLGLREWDDICLLDEHTEAAEARMRKCKIDLPVFRLSDYTPQDGDVVACAIGDPVAKLNVCHLLQAKGAKFTNVIHPSVAIAPSAVLGEGIIITRMSMISVNVTIHDFVTINSFSACGHDAQIEEGCTISGFCDVTGHAHLERGVFLGSHAAIMPGVRVGESAKVAAGSVAFHNVKAGTTVIGVPAKPFF
jgi:sugar O-acyltransferase (sialic acid O-acetyltransferase NeuD family)